MRITGSTSRRQRIFAVTQIAASFVLLAGASAVITTLIALQRAQTGLDTQHVLAIDVPAMSYGKTPQQVVDFYKEAIRRIDALPGVSETAFGDIVPWRDGESVPACNFPGTVTRTLKASKIRGRSRVSSLLVFLRRLAFLSLPAAISMRSMRSDDNKEPVVIVSETLAQRMFPNQDAINRHVYWTDPVLQFFPGTDLEKARLVAPHRIIGVTADIDDGHVVPEPTLTFTVPLTRAQFLAVVSSSTRLRNPYALVTPVTRIIREMSADQPVEHAASLEDIRAEVLTPDRLNSLVFGVFAAVALAIAVVGVAGVLAFSVSARTREFGIRLALGSEPQQTPQGRDRRGHRDGCGGRPCRRGIRVGVGAFGGKIFPGRQDAGRIACVVSAFVLMTVAVIASVLPAARAARVDVMQALRSE